MTESSIGKGNDRSGSAVHSAARVWESVDVLRYVEEPRYPYKRAMANIVSSVVMQHVTPGASIYEVGAGTGFLKDLVPAEFYGNYTSTDYNLGHLQEGQNRRQMTISEANANSLPVEDGSLDAIINLDAYDTLPDLQGAMNEAARVLAPDGTFIHFQSNAPSDDTVIFDHPDYVFIPPRIGENERVFDMVGIKREDLIKALPHIAVPVFREIIESILSDQMGEYTSIQASKRAKDLIDLVHEIVDIIPGARITIPSITEYFKDKMEKAVTNAGLTLTESGYRSVSLRLPRGKYNPIPFSQFSVENGFALQSVNPVLKASGSSDVIEKVTMLAVVGKKAA